MKLNYTKNSALKIGIVSHEFKVHQVIQQLLSPWKVTFCSSDEAEISIVYDVNPSDIEKSIIIPSNSEIFFNWLKNQDIKYKREFEKEIYIDTRKKICLSIKPQFYYQYDEDSTLEDIFPHYLKKDTNSILAVNIIEEYQRLLRNILNPKLSVLYRLLTNFPIQYFKVPSFIRNYFLRKKVTENELNICNYLPIDALRFLLVSTINEMMNKQLERKMWGGKPYADIITHDVDTQDGLKRAKMLKKVEMRYDLPSAWYIPTKRYKLIPEIVQDLANNGEVGSHGTSHDGKLVTQSLQQIKKKLEETKIILEKILGNMVMGFRAPLLQHNENIFQALKMTGFVYDTSIPTWEYMHPSTMKPHGIGSIFPFTFNGLCEIPVTLQQDHQMMKVFGFSVEKTITKWFEIRDIIKDLGGQCTFLIHPDYDFTNPEGIYAYEDLLNHLTSQKSSNIMLPSKLLQFM